MTHFKVIQGHFDTNRNLYHAVCDLLVVNTFYLAPFARYRALLTRLSLLTGGASL